MPTTTPLMPDFVKELVPFMLKAFGDATAHAYRIMWDALMVLLLQHWVIAATALIGILLYAIAHYFLTGRWAVLGSVLYSYCYFGTMFVVGLIWGPELYANDYFPLIGAIVYIVSFSIVGIILLATGVRRR